METEENEPVHLSMNVYQLEASAGSKETQPSRKQVENVEVATNGRRSLQVNSIDMMFRTATSRNIGNFNANGTNEDPEPLSRIRTEGLEPKFEPEGTDNTWWKFLQYKFGGKDTFKARIDLFLIIFDWVIDLAVGVYHLINKRWLAGGLTFFIVFGAGVIVTFTNFSPFDKNKTEMKKEMWKLSKFYGILMYIPSFYPICSAKLRLHFTLKLKHTESEDDRILLREKLQRFKEKALWDMCCESTFESFPQAVLQIVLLFEKDKSFKTFFDFVPLISVLLSLYGITMAPFAVINTRFTDVVLTIPERLTAYSSKALRVLCAGLFIVSFRNFIREEFLLSDVLWTIIPAVIIFSLFDVPYLVKYEIDRLKSTWEKFTNVIIDLMLFFVTSLTLLTWIISCVGAILELRNCVTLGIYIILMIFTYFGLFYHRVVSGLYRTISASVLVHAYVATKAWVLSFTRPDHYNIPSGWKKKIWHPIQVQCFVKEGDYCRSCKKLLLGDYYKGMGTWCLGCFRKLNNPSKLFVQKVRHCSFFHHHIGLENVTYHKTTLKRVRNLEHKEQIMRIKFGEIVDCKNRPI